jgi:hypothetical protein
MRAKIYAILSITLLAFAISQFNHTSANAATIARLNVKVVFGNIITAEVNNTLKIDISNNYDDLYDLDACLTLPPPLVLLTSNHWLFPSFRKGSTISIVTSIYAPASAIGNSYSGSLVLTYKELGYTYSSSETHTIGLVVYGWIKMIAYGLIVDPQPAPAGSEVTISASLLNQGNVAAMYTNVTILPCSPLILKFGSANYIGQVDPNSPAPFSVTADIDPNAESGTYPVTVLVTYQDDRCVTHSLPIKIHIQVVPATPKPQQSQAEAFQAWLTSQGWIYAVTICAAAITVLLFHIFKGKRSQK